MKKSTYLGDGAYADFDGWAVTVRCERGDGEHYVVLEPSVYLKLAEFVAKETPWKLPGATGESGR